jgi:hypothetical protein
VPATVSPFTVLGLLRAIETNNGVSSAERDELLKQITVLERHYFDDDAGDAPDLHAIAETWVRRVGGPAP